MIGIDIGSYCIKVCKVVNAKENKKKFSVYSVLQNVSKMDDKQKQMTIKNLVNKINIKKDTAFLGVGGNNIINREVILPKLKVNSKDFKSLIFKEIMSTINENLASWYTSCTITRNFSDNDVCVLFSAAHKQKITDVVSLVEGLNNIQVVGVTMEGLALANSFIKFGPEYKESESVLLLNIGKDVTNIVVLNNKKIVFVKDVDFGGQHITRDIANVYMIPEMLAEEIKIRVDLKEKLNFNMKNILKISVASFIETIFRTIEYCVTKEFIFAVDRIVITGGGALTDGLDIFIGEILGINTEIWNPLENNDIVGYSNKNYGQFISVALGLALEREVR